MAKIKLCGMTNIEDCMAAVELGVDFVGFVFYERSRRKVGPLLVKRIVEGLCGRVSTVGVFVDETDGEIEAVLSYCGLDYAQVYRDTAVERSIRAYRIDAERPVVSATGLVLFDSFTEGVGGSGRAFNLGLVAGSMDLGRAFIAGGIDEANVGQALGLRPFGIDAASSVEARPGKKDNGKMERLVNKVRGFGT